MPKLKNLTGNSYHFLTVISTYRENNVTWLICRCVCGTVKRISRSNLLKEKRGIKSCGCKYSDRSNRLKYNGNQEIKTKEYRIWSSMRNRCQNKNNKDYNRYGGRGITVCDRWDKSFNNFLSDMGRAPTPNHSIDRFPDKNGNYNPDNCRWATAKQQANNRRSTIFITIDGVTKPLTEWCHESGVDNALAARRIKSGWDPIEAIKTPATTLYLKKKVLNISAGTLAVVVTILAIAL